MGDQFVDPGKLIMCVALGVLLTHPKTQGMDLIGLGIGQKNNLVHESRLGFQDWKNLVLNGFGKLSRSFRLSPNGDDSTEHSVPPFQRVAYSERAYSPYSLALHLHE